MIFSQQFVVFKHLTCSLWGETSIECKPSVKYCTLTIRKQVSVFWWWCWWCYCCWWCTWWWSSSWWSWSSSFRAATTSCTRGRSPECLISRGSVAVLNNPLWKVNLMMIMMIMNMMIMNMMTMMTMMIMIAIIAMDQPWERGCAKQSAVKGKFDDDHVNLECSDIRTHRSDTEMDIGL